jgi:hypothetical protein
MFTLVRVFISETNSEMYFLSKQILKVRGQQVNWLLDVLNLIYSTTLKNTEEKFIAGEIKAEK